MAKGSIAKDALMQRIKTALGKDYVGTDDTGKKFYFWSTENGEKMQIALTMTLAKTPLVCEGNGGDLNFDDDTPVAPKAVMSDEEKATLDKLMKELGL